MKHLRYVLITALFATFLSAVSGHASAAPVVIKFATVAPEGSTWMELLKAASAEVRTKTKGNVDFKYYPGGIAGDEPDVLRKMRVGQYHGGGFTGVGLGELVPEVRILELPMFYRNEQEIDLIKGKLTADLAEKFKAKGMIFLGWAEPGAVYLFAQKPISGPQDLHGVKMWAWEADPLAEAMIAAFKITPVHIALPDVLMALQTGMLNAVYAPPMAAMALQWHTKVKFMMNEPLAYATGGALIAKKQWDQISPADQATVRETFKTYLGKLETTTRLQNKEAVEKFKQLGIKVEPVTKAGRDEIIAAAAQIRPQLVGKLYSAVVLKKVEDLLADYRKKHK